MRADVDAHDAVVGRQDVGRPERREGHPAHLWPEIEVAFVIDARCTDVQMVEADASSVESRLVAGEIACPGCGGELRPWGHARWRTLRDHGRPVRLRPRRSRCRSCLVTHVLLPVLALLRRLDLAAVIVETLVARHMESRTRVELTRSIGAPGTR